MAEGARLSAALINSPRLDDLLRFVLLKGLRDIQDDEIYYCMIPVRDEQSTEVPDHPHGSIADLGDRASTMTAPQRIPH